MLVMPLTANSTASSSAKLLIISIDGLRWDYLSLHQPRFLQQLAAQSAQVQRLQPVYPSKTFPNHLSLATGLYPEHHGIVANRFYSPPLQRAYKLSDPKAVTDAAFYQGTPIWSLAEQQGRTSAVFFWPGSEAKIAGFRPSYFKQYDSKTSHRQRIRQVLQWFRQRQVDLAMVYFSSVDRAGHDWGPESFWTKRALRSLDSKLEQLFTELAKLPLAVNVIITGDHGMRDVTAMPTLLLDQRLASWRQFRQIFRISGSGSTVRFYHRGGANKAADLRRLAQLLGDHSDSQFFLQPQIPTELHYRDHPAVGDALLISNSHFITFSDAKSPPAGFHGFDPKVDDQMDTLLLGFGPAFAAGSRVDKATVVDVYPLAAKVLGLEISEPIDGRLANLAGLLAE